MTTPASHNPASPHPHLATLAAAQCVDDLLPTHPTAFDAVIEWVDSDTGRIDEAIDLAGVNTEGVWSGTAAAAFQQAHAQYLADAHELARSGRDVRDALTQHRIAVQSAHDQAAKVLRVYRAARAQYAAATAPDAELAANAVQQQQIASSALDAAQRLLSRTRNELTTAASAAEEVILRAAEAVQRTHQRLRHTPSAPVPSPTEIVRNPINGVHDSLWRIAQRRLGAGQRWPEIYQLNKGHTFPDGRTLSNPGDIQPGWTLTLPPTPPPALSVPHSDGLPTLPPHLRPGHVAPNVPGGHAHSGAYSHQPSPGASSVPSPVTTGAARPTTHGDLGVGLVLGGGIIAVLGGIAAATGLHRAVRRSAARTSDATPPIVRRLRPSVAAADPPPVAPDHHLAEPEGENEGPVDLAALPVGVRDGREVLVDVAAAFGLGLTGPGAADALRAVVIALLASHPGAEIHVPRPYARPLTGTTTAPTGFRLRVHDALADILNIADVELLTRTRLLEESAGRQSMPAFVIVTQADADLEAQRRRLQAVADNGAGLGVSVVVLGAWPSGVTCHIDVDGVIVRATGPGSHDLVGTRVFTAPILDTRQILELLDAIPTQRTQIQPTPAGNHRAGRPTKVTAQRPTDGRLPTAFVPPPPPGVIEARLNPSGEERSTSTVAFIPAVDRADPDTRAARTWAVNVAAQHGLGLLGVGADAAARALLIHILDNTDARMAMTEDDATRLMGANWPRSPRLYTASAPDDLLDELDRSAASATVLVATPSPSLLPRLQALINGQLTCIILGRWPAGNTIQVSADGTVTATEPTDDRWSSTRLFLPGSPAPQTLVELLSATPTTPHTDQPAPAISCDPSPESPPISPPAMPSGTKTRHVPHRHVWSLSVLGPMSLTWRHDDVEQEVTAALAPKHWALLVFLALHPAGTTREIVREALWPNTQGNRPYNAYYTTLTQVRKALHAATSDKRRIIVQRGERVGLDPDLTEVDYWQLLDAEHAARVASTTDSRTAAWSTIVAVYGGDLADGVDALWLDGPREAARRTTVDALARLAALSRGHDAERHLQLLEQARLLDRYNEDIYRDIMRVQAELGLVDAIPRTLALLTTTLSDNNERPASDTVALAHALQSRQRRTEVASDLSGLPSASERD